MYFRIFTQEDKKYFGFIFDEDATDSDYPIRKKDYDEYFRLEREEGKNFRLKERLPENPTGLFDYLEEYIPEQREFPKTETEVLQEKITAVQKQNELLDGALNEILFTILPEIQGGEI